jgi:hypothetical protein
MPALVSCADRAALEPPDVLQLAGFVTTTQHQKSLSGDVHYEVCFRTNGSGC